MAQRSAIPAQGSNVQARAIRIDNEMARQVEVLAYRPNDGLMWSDVFAHLREGLTSARRLFATRHAAAAR